MKAHAFCLFPCLLLVALAPVESVDVDESRVRAVAGERTSSHLYLSVRPPLGKERGIFADTRRLTQAAVGHLNEEKKDDSVVPLLRYRRPIDTDNTVWRSSPSEIVAEDAETIATQAQKRAAPWPGGWALCAYGLLATVIVWACSRIYSSYVLQRKSEDLANRIYETESEADDDLHEFIETQSELVAAAQAHGEVTLSVMRHCISSQLNEQQNVSGQRLAQGSLKRIDALSSLALYTQIEAEGAQVDLHSFVDATVNDMLRTTPVRPETVISINDIEQAHLPSEIATPIGLVLFELLENAFLHAFANSSPANYIHMQMRVEDSGHRRTHAVHLSIQDSGRGFPQDLHTVCKANSGIAIVKGLIARLNGEINFASEPNAQIRIIVPNISPNIGYT